MPEFVHLVIADLEIVHAYRLVALEIGFKLLFDVLIVFGFHHMRIAPGNFDDFAVSRHQLAVLENIFGLGEHFFLVRIFAVNGDIGGRSVTEMPAVSKAEDFRRRGAGHDGDFVKRIFARKACQRSHCRRIGIDGGKCVVSVGFIHEQSDKVRVAHEWRAIGMIRGKENAPRVVDHQENFQADSPLQCVDKILVAIAERHHAAAGVALDVHNH